MILFLTVVNTTSSSPSFAYNMAPYKPKDIKQALLNKNKNSAPGYDEVVYEYLLNMPFLHQILATTFTRIREKPPKAGEKAKSY